jgi:hypothetical protein
VIHISETVLDEARAFFEDCGAQGCEGTALIAAKNDVADLLVIPDQRATPHPQSSVEVTDKGKRQLATALGLDRTYVARIHSHPGLAFHSDTDDRNPALTFEGAVSVVVPFFGLGLRNGLDACALYELRAGRWILVEPGSGRDRPVDVR